MVTSRSQLVRGADESTDCLFKLNPIKDPVVTGTDHQQRSWNQSMEKPLLHPI